MANWIKAAVANRGGLHRSLGVPTGSKIPLPKIRMAAKRSGRVGAQARLALTLRKLHG